MLEKINKIYKKTIEIFLDLLFPLSKEEKEIREITLDQVYQICHRTNTHGKNIISIFDYRDPLIRKMVHSLKFKRNKKMAKIFAEAIYNELLEEIIDLEVFSNFKDPLLVPIPISKKRYRERGFNQAEIITQEINFLDQNNSFRLETDNLLKIKNTPAQSSLKNRKERLENLKDCFSIKRPEKIKGRNIILIDDVTTTGSTIKEAKKILKTSGARKVIAITFAC